MATGPSVEEEENAIPYLNTYATKHQISPADYIEKSVSGEPHKRTFTITCKFCGLEVTCEGRSKKDAKKSCAVSMVRKMKESGVAEDRSTEYNPVTMLQQFLQKKSLSLPMYQFIQEGGVPHSKTFTIRATASNLDGSQYSTEATASSKKEAKKKAADELYNKLKPVLDKSPKVSCVLHAGDHNITRRWHLDQVKVKVKTKTTSTTTKIETSMASMNIGGEVFSSRSHDDTDSSISSSVNPLDDSVDPQDISVNPQDIDVVYLDGEGSKLCLATLNHHGQDVTACGNGSSKDIAKNDAIKNLMSNLSILYPSLHNV